MDTNTEIFDALDIDLVIKVLSNTAFSEVQLLKIEILLLNSVKIIFRPILHVLYPDILCLSRPPLDAPDSCWLWDVVRSVFSIL